MTKVLVVLGEGGHTVEILRAIEPLGPKYEYSYLMPKHDRTSEVKIKVAGPVYRVNLPRGKHSNFLINLKYSIMCSFQELSVLLKVRPKAILSAGAGIAVPVSVFGRLLGVKIIYVETATRVHTLSMTGRIMYHVAHLFFVQWEPLKEKYPEAVFAGRLL
jgi:UDP-N-acetylglucosamine:LPS N-acetylglucosamine transferase